MSEPTHRLVARVHGRVQGVSFRETTRQKALALGLTGWVRNDDDGSVHITAEGLRPSLEQFTEFLATGPIMARVTRVETHWQAATGEFTTFAITR